MKKENDNTSSREAKNQTDVVYAIRTRDSRISAWVVFPVPETASNNGMPKVIATDAAPITSNEGMDAFANAISFGING